MHTYVTTHTHTHTQQTHTDKHPFATHIHTHTHALSKTLFHHPMGKLSARRRPRSCLSQIEWRQLIAGFILTRPCSCPAPVFFNSCDLFCREFCRKLTGDSTPWPGRVAQDNLQKNRFLQLQGVGDTNTRKPSQPILFCMKFLFAFLVFAIRQIVKFQTSVVLFLPGRHVAAKNLLDALFCPFCSWAFSRFASIQLLIFNSLRCWYGWAFSDTLVELAFLERRNVADKSFLQCPADLQECASRASTLLVWLLGFCRKTEAKTLRHRHATL